MSQNKDVELGYWLRIAGLCLYPFAILVAGFAAWEHNFPKVFVGIVMFVVSRFLFSMGGKLIKKGGGWKD